MASSTSSTRILSVYKSRNTMIEQLDKQGFDVTDYQEFSINEVDAMITNSQLDMLMTHKTDGRKVYVKYYANKQIRPPIVDTIIEDLYTIESVLTKPDTLIIVIDDEPNDTISDKVKYIYDRYGYFVILFNIKRLQFNILNHVYVPSASILPAAEMADFMKTYQIRDLTQLPEISRFDPHAMSVGVRPGQIMRFERNSTTAMKSMYYRACV
jgi:DNA-directed RNA polymerase subunit H (RpoH/RPB5)